MFLPGMHGPARSRKAVTVAPRIEAFGDVPDLKKPFSGATVAALGDRAWRLPGVTMPPARCVLSC
jgi:hypothetical protein